LKTWLLKTSASRIIFINEDQSSMNDNIGCFYSKIYDAVKYMIVFFLVFMIAVLDAQLSLFSPDKLYPQCYIRP